MNKTDLLRDQWASLGVAFNSKPKSICDPETALISLVKSKEFPEDKKMISLALTWLSQYSTFVHIEKLKTQINQLDLDAVSILGAISAKCIDFGDHRWKTIESLAKKKLGKRMSNLHDEEVFLNRNGTDSHFLKYGIRVIPINPDDPNKLYVRKRIIKMNVWLKTRLLFGTNLRADIASIQLLKIADTAYAASKLLGCSLNAAYRNWNDLTEAGWTK